MDKTYPVQLPTSHGKCARVLSENQ